MKSSSKVLQNRRTVHFISDLNDCDEMVHHEPLALSPDRPIVNGRPDGAWIVCVIKRI